MCVCNLLIYHTCGPAGTSKRPGCPVVKAGIPPTPQAFEFKPTDRSPVGGIGRKACDLLEEH